VSLVEFISKKKKKQLKVGMFSFLVKVIFHIPTELCTCNFFSIANIIFFKEGPKLGKFHIATNGEHIQLPSFYYH
jgi:hypothetical protein